MIEIPQELVSLAAERRLIPFVGAGFSAALNLPTWEHMLRDLCSRIEGSMPFDDLKKATGGDYLQIAEYLFLKCDRQIGPIRRQLERSLGNHKSPLLSGPHVELVNLGAAQIYTTNYDDLIETTYRELGRAISPVVLPKDVALADTDRTQVVKYHGDLSYERTLVLTESAYYKRLDFESPMDLKFRSDLLGKSVLFMGYSFNDVNIRIIWFKLMEMMRDIPEADRRPSYIVRLEPNAALDELNAAVGLKTIVLHPDGPVNDPHQRVKLLGSFLLQLSAAAASESKLVREQSETLVSAALLDSVREIQNDLGDLNYPKSMMWRFRGFWPVHEYPLSRLLKGTVPEPLKDQWQKCLEDVLPSITVKTVEDVQLVLSKLRPSTSLTSFVVRLLAGQGDPDARKVKSGLINDTEIWSRVWASPPTADDIEMILGLFSNEINYQERQGADEDIVYLADLAKRVALGQMGPVVTKDDLEKAQSLLDRAAEVYPSISEMKPAPDGPPAVEDVLVEVHKRQEDFTPFVSLTRSTKGPASSANPAANGRRQGRPTQGDGNGELS